MSDLVKRLRDPCFDSKCGKVRREGADRIEALEREGENYDCNVAILTKQRDDALALLREARNYVTDDAKYYGEPYTADLLARIDALLDLQEGEIGVYHG